MDSRRTRRQYPVFVEPIDKTGRTKARTLEFFLNHKGPHKAKELYSDPEVASPLMKGGRCIEIRLLKYCRMGLLSREREGRAYRYSITTEGENRLRYLWDRLGYLTVGPSNSELEREVVRKRLKTCIALVDKQLDAIDNRLSV